MAGQGNVPKGSKEKSDPLSPSSFNAIYSDQSSIAGDPVMQNKIYVLPPAQVLASVSLAGGAATDWFYLAGGNATGATAYNVSGQGATDWVSFESYSRSTTTYNAFSGGARIDLGSDFSYNGQFLMGGGRIANALGTRVGTVANVENVWGSDGNDLIIGSSTSNELHGGAGNDKIFGVAGNNLLYGETGNDVIVGGAGNGSFNGGDGNDYIQSARGNDWIDGGEPGPVNHGSARTFQNPAAADANLSGGGLSLLNYGDSVDYSYLPAGWRVTLALNGAQWVDATVSEERGSVRERDKVCNIENIVGGAGGDPLVGDGNANVLDGGQGDDTVQGGGGDDLVLGSGGGNDSIDGGAGTDEISFVPVVEPVLDTSKYSPANNKLNDDKSLVLDLRLDDGHGRYSYNTVETSALTNQPGSASASVLAGSVDNPWRGAMTSIENVTGTDKNDQIAGNAQANVLNGYDGNDILYGAGGNDTLIGGQGNDWAMFRDATAGNRPRYQSNALNVDPVFSAYNDDGSPYAGGGSIRLDAKTFGFSGSSGAITSVENVLGSTGNDLIVGNDADNILVGEAGRDTVYGGAGADRVFGGPNAGAGYDTSKMDALWGGAGDDIFFAGFNYNPVVGTAKIVSLTEGGGALSNAYGTLPVDGSAVDHGIVRLNGRDGNTNLDDHEAIHDWQTGDSLFLAKDWVVVINGLGQSNGSGYTGRFEPGNPGSSQAYDWSGDDTVDLRSIDGTRGNNENKLATDFGKLVVDTGAGDDHIFGSNGNDWIYAGSGRNDIDLGSDAGGDGADRVVIDTFQGEYNVRGFDIEDSIWIDRRIVDSVIAARGISTPALTYASADKAATSLSGGQAYGNGDWFTSQHLYDESYDGILRAYTEIGFPGRDPDAFGPLDGPFPYGWSSNGAWNNDVHQFAHDVARPIVIAAGSLSLLLGNAVAAIPFVGPLLAIPLWVNGGFMLNDGINLVHPHQNAEYGGATLDYGVNLLSSNKSPASTVGTWDARNLLDFYQTPDDRFTPSLEFSSHPADQGIGSFVTVYNGSETFIYLVYSKDGILQDNEARLIAQVNGQISASQIHLYDGASDSEITRYLAQDPFVEPVFAPDVVAVALKQDGDATAPAPDALLTADASPTVVLTLDKALGASDTLVVSFGGSEVDAGSIAISGDTVTVSLPSQSSDGHYLLSVGITSAQGFTSNFSTAIGIDANPIAAGDVSVQSSADGLTFGFRPDDPDTVPYDGAQAEPATVTLTLEDSAATTLDVLLNGANSYGGSMTLGPQDDMVGGSLSITDALGRTTELSGWRVILGTDTAGGDAISGADGKVNFLYGFGGADTIVGGDLGDSLYGGEGADALEGAAGGDILFGGLGKDAMTGGTGADIFVWSTAAEFDEGDEITDFSSLDGDKLQFSAVSLGQDFYTTEETVYEVPGGDDIVVSRVIPKQLTAGQLESGAGMVAATQAATRFFLNETTGDLYYDADGAGGAAAMLVATLTGVSELSDQDFLIA